ncbi:MAG: hypothetical protein IT373_16265 [Polyangiaceae bacterium]|nr:hypothetical protein [Polyangiaceae bacterium]
MRSSRVESPPAEALGELLERVGTLPLERAIAIARDALDGLGYAHERGLVHRDVKPGNLFVCAPDEQDRVARERTVVMMHAPSDGEEPDGD